VQTTLSGRTGPAGWFAVALSSELPNGRVLVRRLAGRDVVVWQTELGQVRAAEAHCPHLGAHLGYGGRVRGENLICPFHHFAYDPAGTCVATPYGPPPARARLSLLPVRTLMGAVLVYNSGPAINPGWEPRFLPAHDGQWSRWHWRTWSLPADLRDIAEHAVDTGHLQALHLLGDLEVLAPVTFQGHVMQTRYRARQYLPAPLPHRPVATATFSLVAQGLGIATGDIEVRTWPGYRAVTRLMMLATPTDPGRLDLRVACSLRRAAPGTPRTVLTPFRVLADRCAERIAFALFTAEVGQEARIWRHKRYRDDPVLNDADGPIGEHRRWARQFGPARY
jgi:phenylpropionate dioxygenase-like ring-hydroxylating dioxygenase large terminal subunit